MVDVIVVIGAIVVGVVSVARLARLITQDSFPPSVWFRMKWDDWTNDGDWSTLMHCHWCITPWLTVPVGLWGWLSELHTSWWVFNGIFAAAYVSGMIVERDEVD